MWGRRRLRLAHAARTAVCSVDAAAGRLLAEAWHQQADMLGPVSGSVANWTWGLYAVCTQLAVQGQHDCSVICVQRSRHCKGAGCPPVAVSCSILTLAADVSAFACSGWSWGRAGITSRAWGSYHECDKHANTLQSRTASSSKQ